LQTYATQQDQLRPGSSIARSESYLTGVAISLERGPIVFLAGSGVKPRKEGSAYGAGSESTYISLFVRGGAVAVAAFLTFLVLSLRRAIQEKDLTAVALVVGLAVHAAVEDLDVGTLTLLFGMVQVARLPTLSPAARRRVRPGVGRRRVVRKSLIDYPGPPPALCTVSASTVRQQQ
jgi:hypothetical protein